VHPHHHLPLTSRRIHPLIFKIASSPTVLRHSLWQFSLSGCHVCRVRVCDFLLAAWLITTESCFQISNIFTNPLEVCRSASDKNCPWFGFSERRAPPLWFRPQIFNPPFPNVANRPNFSYYRAMLCIRGTSHGPVSVRLSVCYKSVFYRNGSTNRAVFWHVSFFPPVLHCVKRKFGYLKNKGTSLWNFVLNSGLRQFRHG